MTPPDANRENEIEAEALRRASAALGIPLDDPKGEAIIRKSLVFACVRLELSVKEVFRPLWEPFDRVVNWFVKKLAERTPR